MDGRLERLNTNPKELVNKAGLILANNKKCLELIAKRQQGEALTPEEEELVYGYEKRPHINENDEITIAEMVQRLEAAKKEGELLVAQEEYKLRADITSDIETLEKRTTERSLLNEIKKAIEELRNMLAKVQEVSHSRLEQMQEVVAVQPSTEQIAEPLIEEKGKEELKKEPEENEQVEEELKNVFNRLVKSLPVEDFDHPQKIKEKIKGAICAFPPETKKMLAGGGDFQAICDSLVDRYASIFRESAEHYVKMALHSAEQEKQAKQEKEFKGKVGSVLKSEGKTILKTAGSLITFGGAARLVIGFFGGAAAIPAYAIAGGVTGVLNYTLAKMGKESAALEQGKKIANLEVEIGKENIQKMQSQIVEDVAAVAGLDATRQTTLSYQSELLSTNKITFAGNEKEVEEKKKVMVELIKHTQDVLRGSLNSKEQKKSLEERSKKIKEARKNGALNEFVANLAAHELQQQKLEGLSEEEKRAVQLGFHLLVEQQINGLLADVVAQEKFAGKKGTGFFKGVYDNLLYQKEAPTSMWQVLVRDTISGAAAGAVSGTWAGTVYMGLRRGVSAWSGEIIRRTGAVDGQERAVKTSSEIVQGLHELCTVEGVSAEQVKVAITEARARIKLPDIKEGDRARIEREASKLQKEFVQRQLLSGTIDQNNQLINEQINSLAEHYTIEQQKTAQTLLNRAKEEKSLSTLGRAFWKMNKAEKKAVLKKTAIEAGKGAAYARLLGFAINPAMGYVAHEAGVLENWVESSLTSEKGVQDSNLAKTETSPTSKVAATAESKTETQSHPQRLEVELGQNGAPKFLEQLYYRLGIENMDLGDKVENVEAARVLNVGANMRELTQGHNVAGVSADEFAKYVTVGDDGKIIIDDYKGFQEHVAQPLVEHAEQLITPENVGQMGATAYIDNLRHDTWGELLKPIGLDADDLNFDEQQIDAAEQHVVHDTLEHNGYAEADVHNLHITDEANYTFDYHDQHYDVASGNLLPHLVGSGAGGFGENGGGVSGDNTGDTDVAHSVIRGSHEGADAKDERVDLPLPSSYDQMHTASNKWGIPTDLKTEQLALARVLADRGYNANVHVVYHHDTTNIGYHQASLSIDGHEFKGVGQQSYSAMQAAIESIDGLHRLTVTEHQQFMSTLAASDKWDVEHEFNNTHDKGLLARALFKGGYGAEEEVVMRKRSVPYRTPDGQTMTGHSVITLETTVGEDTIRGVGGSSQTAFENLLSQIYDDRVIVNQHERFDVDKPNSQYGRRLT